MPPQDRVRLNDAGQSEQARPPSGHPNHQDTVTCPKPDTSWGSPQGDVELMTRGGLNRSAMKVASRWMIANIASDDALILPHRANPTGLNFRERQP
jgi:hypothetical protein